MACENFALIVTVQLDNIFFNLLKLYVPFFGNDKCSRNENT